jgi:hypothetical protein
VGGLAVPESREIAELETPSDAKELYDKIETLSQYAKRYGLDHAKQNEIAEAKLRTARKGGKLLAAKPPQSRDATTGTFLDGKTLPDGITRSMSSRWQLLASIPDEKWEASIAHAKATANDELTLDRMVRIGREMKLGGRSEKREKQAKARAKQHAPKKEIVIADVQDWRPQGVHSIITDPPYVGDSLPLYRALRDFAVDVLPAGGPLVVMTWQGILPSVLRALEHPQLVYRWCLSWRYASAENSTVDYTRRVFDRWKPVLVFHKDAMPNDATMVSDEITSEAPDKTHHEWGQSLEGFEHLVKAFSKERDLVCDPFVGGGTTGLAALALNRDFVGCDLDADAVETTVRRLAA